MKLSAIPKWEWEALMQDGYYTLLWLQYQAWLDTLTSR